MTRDFLNPFKSNFSAIVNVSELVHLTDCISEHKISFIYKNDKNEEWKLIMIFNHGNRHYLYSKCDDDEHKGNQMYRMRLLSFALSSDDKPAYVLSDRRCSLLEAMSHVTNYILTDDLMIHN